MLRNEYEKMQERLRIMQMKEANRVHEELPKSREIEKAEKDDNSNDGINDKISDEPTTAESSQSNLIEIMSKVMLYSSMSFSSNICL